MMGPVKHPADALFVHIEGGELQAKTAWASDNKSHVVSIAQLIEACVIRERKRRHTLRLPSNRHQR